jgi:Pretoxin HINT domain
VSLGVVTTLAQFAQLLVVVAIAGVTVQKVVSLLPLLSVRRERLAPSRPFVRHVSFAEVLLLCLGVSASSDCSPQLIALEVRPVPSQLLFESSGTRQIAAASSLGSTPKSLRSMGSFQVGLLERSGMFRSGGVRLQGTTGAIHFGTIAERPNDPAIARMVANPRSRCCYDSTPARTTPPQFVATKTRVPCASFRADTLVLMADGSKKLIGEIEVGDKVVATDPVTGKTSVRTVTRLFTHVDDDLLDVLVLTDDGVETIHTTDHHRFWNGTRKAWVEARELRGGERLLTADGDLVTIGGLKRVPGSAPMLDLTVEYDHTFYVALNNTAVLVHNQTCPLNKFNQSCINADELPALERSALGDTISHIDAEI